MNRGFGAIDRATFLKRAGGFAVVALFGRSGAARAADPRLMHPAADFVHPDPRPGITSEHVLTTESLGASPPEKLVRAYDAARAYPEVFDGLACGCGCTGNGGEHRSLLVCYETRQPAGCNTCQSEANLVAGMAKDEKPLSEIRAAVSKKYG